MANSVDPDQTAPIGAVCSGSTLFASILNSSVMLGNYLQQTTSADDIFRCISALFVLLLFLHCFIADNVMNTVRLFSLCNVVQLTCLKQPLKKSPKLGFQYRLSLNAGQRIGKCAISITFDLHKAIISL